MSTNVRLYNPMNFSCDLKIAQQKRVKLLLTVCKMFLVQSISILPPPWSVECPYVRRRGLRVFVDLSFQQGRKEGVPINAAILLNTA
jgi:hypothetical protein